jgi:Xaa-Pro aminopeptidase
MNRFVTKEKMTDLYDGLTNLGLDILYITDTEAHRNINMKYLSGHPEDATLIVDVKNRGTILIPWDYQLAQEYAEVDQIVNMADYGGVIPASAETLKNVLESNTKIGVTRSIPYSNIQAIKDTTPKADIIWDPQTIDSLLEKLRSTKSPFELSLLQKSVKISNQIVDEMEDILTSTKTIKTEMDLAIFVESRMRELGAFGIGFESLVASSARSWQIHTYPRADPELPFYREGLALIDFGVNAAGLTSDVTLPFIMGKMNQKMKNIVEIVKQTHDEAVDKLKEAHFLHEVADVAFDIIESAGFSMPHGLGHGIGLVVHDSPFIRKKPTHEVMQKDWTEVPIEEGMVITIEPGIYEQDVGGFRLENDVIITSKGPEVVTNSRPVFIDL